MIQKELSVKELFNELKVLKYRLIKLADRYNRSLISVSAITYKDIISKSSFKGDVMLDKMAKREELTNEFDEVLFAYREYKAKTIEEIRKMLNENPVEYCIVYFRDELEWKWDDISKMFNYSVKQCHRLYKKFKNVS